MNTDRDSAYYSAYNSVSRHDALQHEFVNGVKVIQEESIPGMVFYSTICYFNDSLVLMFNLSI